ncbi:helix-turn-helix domain-containing protein [Gordonia sp. (in: high G+C Gram-positive bacteria)]|jgi:transcriptional regulator of acetoin/glycerol metabolism|uniref:helix-turn-helix domain-containing protein n=1 Tax=Gordonia sp. (in: high G+C Gram-positive bacteria) TaxID=84139 RepID=UPI001D7BD6B3|nr:helix-turn-helix domain-containing protein [Gordonia sp. (in: high G+C Gram-positive bacteria)]MCB1295205.1 Fis family transcriptional regulator [Gordonia sp. (in: high G+C Gram-positive bacteria)]HMS73672.1 helix-turn-helix domain-containing protein [Gordonia sp. (in: high G+C Gram-positive bacteria)]
MAVSSPQRPVIAASWRRSRHAGLVEDVRPEPSLADVAAADPLLDAARPVLARAAEALSGTSTALLLVDAGCRLVTRVTSDATLEGLLTAAGAVTGADFQETTMGTTALGTTAEVRSDVVINSGEHYLEQFRIMSCFGRPIIHPATRRLAGTICMTEIADRMNPLSVPLIHGVVDDIAERLLDRSRADNRTVIAAFERACMRRDAGVAAVGHDVQLTNSLAAQFLGPGDFATLRLLAAEAFAPETVTLVSGVTMEVLVQRVPGVTHAAVFMLRPADHDVMSAAGFAVHAKGSPTTAVCGESGTGRTTRARMLAGDAIYVDVAAGLLDGRAPNVPVLLRHARTAGRPLVIDGIDFLDGRSLALLRTAVTTAAPEQPPLVLVSGPPGELTAAAAAVVACCGVRVDLAPLRRRETELAATVQQLLAGIDDRLTLNADAADCLVTQEWPGNLTELRIVLQQAAAATLRRGDRQVSGADLPDSHRTPTRVGRLLGRERAERQAIISALDAADRNKSRAAKALGISRTTLYTRMRALDIRS